MSTKAKIQKIRAEVEAHEERGWLKGYEEGMAKREAQIVEAQAALEVHSELIRELSHQKKGPTTVQEALDLAWELAHPVKEGQHIQEGVRLLVRTDSNDLSAYSTQSDITINAWDSLTIRTLDPLPDPLPDWLDAPAVTADCECSPGGQAVHVSHGEIGWTCTSCDYPIAPEDMENVTPLYPKEDA